MLYIERIDHATHIISNYTMSHHITAHHSTSHHHHAISHHTTSSPYHTTSHHTTGYSEARAASHQMQPQRRPWPRLGGGRGTFGANVRIQQRRGRRGHGRDQRFSAAMEGETVSMRTVSLTLTHTLTIYIYTHTHTTLTLSLTLSRMLTHSLAPHNRPTRCQPTLRVKL